MANFFDEEFLNCEKCNCLLFEKIKYTSYKKEGAYIVPVTNNKALKCMECGETILLKNDNQIQEQA